MLTLLSSAALSYKIFKYRVIKKPSDYYCHRSELVQIVGKYLYNTVIIHGDQCRDHPR